MSSLPIVLGAKSVSSRPLVMADKDDELINLVRNCELASKRSQNHAADQERQRRLLELIQYCAGDAQDNIHACDLLNVAGHR